jgi:hypothetical protein
MMVSPFFNQASSLPCSAVNLIGIAPACRRSSNAPGSVFIGGYRDILVKAARIATVGIDFRPLRRDSRAAAATVGAASRAQAEWLAPARIRWLTASMGHRRQHRRRSDFTGIQRRHRQGVAGSSSVRRWSMAAANIARGRASCGAGATALRVRSSMTVSHGALLVSMKETSATH